LNSTHIVSLIFEIVSLSAKCQLDELALHHPRSDAEQLFVGMLIADGPALNVDPMAVTVLSLAVFHCKLNLCLTSWSVGIAGNKLRCNAFSDLVLGSQAPGAGGFFPID
jgi:hypothetical protein